MGAPDPVAVILFDGVCNLCNGSVQFIIKRDRDSRFRFAALQSEFGRNQLKRFNLPPDALYSVMLIEGDKLFQKSTAALKIAKSLGGAWPLMYGFIVVPRFARDWIYDFIAANRYRWFGKKDECMIPTPELRARFLD